MKEILKEKELKRFATLANVKLKEGFLGGLAGTVAGAAAGGPVGALAGAAIGDKVLDEGDLDAVEEGINEEEVVEEEQLDEVAPLAAGAARALPGLLSKGVAFAKANPMTTGMIAGSMMSKKSEPEPTNENIKSKGETIMKKNLQESEIKRFATLANVKLSNNSLKRLLTEAVENKDEDEDEFPPEEGAPEGEVEGEDLPPAPDAGELPSDAEGAGLGDEGGGGVSEDKVESLVSAIANAIASETGISVEVEGEPVEGGEDMDMDNLDIEEPSEPIDEVPPDDNTDDIDLEDEDEEQPVEEGKGAGKFGGSGKDQKWSKAKGGKKPVEEAHENPRFSQADKPKTAEHDLQESMVNKIMNKVLNRVKKINEAKKVAASKKGSLRLRKLHEARKRRLMTEAKVDKVYARVVKRLISESKKQKLLEARKRYLAQKAAKAKK